MSWSQVVGASLVALALIASGCGPNCQSTCNRLYSTDGDACNITRPGTSQSDLVDKCMDKCSTALEYPGEVGSYDPYSRQGSSNAFVLENEKQAAVWMDCIAATDCEDLTKGYCAPVW